MSAWEQWGGRKPAANGLQGAQDAWKRLVSSPALSTSSTTSTSSDESVQLSYTKAAWKAARDFTKSAVVTPAAATDAADVMESGHVMTAQGINERMAVSGRFFGWSPTKTSQRTLTSSMSWNTRFKYGVGLALLGLLFFGLATIFLPLLMVRPSKFALSFTLGSMCWMGAFAMLKGPAVYVAGLLQPNRLLLTIAYFATLGCTLYSCLVLGNYVLVVLSSVMQLMTLGSFALSVFPAGNLSLKAFGALFWKSASSMIQALARLFG